LKKEVGMNGKVEFTLKPVTGSASTHGGFRAEVATGKGDVVGIDGVIVTMGCRVERDSPVGYARPLIEPYVQVSRIRLSVWDWFHQFRSPSPLGSVSH
jgi:hypothetical protein